jgi:F0F1-type ATP synthase epsilon subunit
VTDISQQNTEDAVQGAAVKHSGERPKMKVKVYASFEVFFEGDAYSISAVNAVGPFDILPKHHNFLCMLVPCDIKIDAPEGQKIVKISRALMHVKADRVAVFVNV